MKQAILLLVVIGVMCGSALLGMYINADGTVQPTMEKIAFAVIVTFLNAGGIFVVANSEE